MLSRTFCNVILNLEEWKMATILGNKIRAERKKLKLTLEQLADAIDSSKSYVWELENKEGTNPTAEKIAKLANALKVSADYLIIDEQQEPTQLDQAKTLWRRVENLTPEQKAALEAVLSSLENRSKA
jgi:transcriptional regulator with XRE-family HTH domain